MRKSDRGVLWRSGIPGTLVAASLLATEILPSSAALTGTILICLKAPLFIQEVLPLQEVSQYRLLVPE